MLSAAFCSSTFKCVLYVTLGNASLLMRWTCTGSIQCLCCSSAFMMLCCRWICRQRKGEFEPLIPPVLCLPLLSLMKGWTRVPTTVRDGESVALGTRPLRFTVSVKPTGRGTPATFRTAKTTVATRTEASARARPAFVNLDGKVGRQCFTLASVTPHCGCGKLSLPKAGFPPAHQAQMMMMI